MQPRFLFALAALAACGDDGSSARVDAGATLDAPADARPDAAADANLSTGLVGTWLVAPDAYADQEYDSVVFRADGTATMVRDGTTTNIPYVVPAPGRLRWLDTDGYLESGFVMVGDQLLLNALAPQGPVTGFLGTWVGTLTGPTMTITATLTIVADHTASSTTQTPSGLQTLDATWIEEGTGFAITWGAPANHTEHVRPLGPSIGNQLLKKQP